MDAAGKGGVGLRPSPVLDCFFFRTVAHQSGGDHGRRCGDAARSAAPHGARTRAQRFAVLTSLIKAGWSPRTQPKPKQGQKAEVTVEQSEPQTVSLGLRALFDAPLFTVVSGSVPNAGAISADGGIEKDG